MLPTIVLYTHTDYKDIWPIFFGQADIYLNEYEKFIFVDKYDKDIPNKYEQIYYNDQYKYTNRVYSCLSKIQEDKSILFLHEDMILYNNPNNCIIQEFVSLILNNKADFIKLIKAGGNFIKSSIHNNLVCATQELLFSVQPTICKISKLKSIYNCGEYNIWDFENIVSNLCIYNGYINCFMSSDDIENKRGLMHWDSNIFPYIATAIVKGKWNYTEYPNELNQLFSKYNIDKNIRGLT